MKGEEFARAMSSLKVIIRRAVCRRVSDFIVHNLQKPNSIRLIEVVVYSKLHRTLDAIVRRNIILLHMPTMYSAPYRYVKTFRTCGSKVKREYRIQDGGRPSAGIPKIFDE
jgi:hypothetical protein